MIGLDPGELTGPAQPGWIGDLQRQGRPDRGDLLRIEVGLTGPPAGAMDPATADQLDARDPTPLQVPLDPAPDPGPVVAYPQAGEGADGDKKCDR